MPSVAIRRGLPVLKDGMIDLASAKLLVSPSLKQITVKHARQGPGNAGARHFMKTKVPFLRYHNPGLVVVNVAVGKGAEGAASLPVAELVFATAKGATDKTQSSFVSLDIRERTADQIADMVIDAARPEPPAAS